MAKKREEYESDEVMCMHHFPDFYRGNFQFFTTYDEFGRVRAYVSSKKGRWVAGHPDRGWTVGHYTRSAALKAYGNGEGKHLVPLDTSEIVKSKEGKIIWQRELFFVEPRTGHTSVFSLKDGGALPSDTFSPWTVVAAAVVQTNPRTGMKHAVLSVRSETGFCATTHVEESGLLPDARTYLEHEEFLRILNAFTASLNNVDNVRNLALQTHALVPEMEFMPAHLLPMLDDQPSLGRIFLQYDLTHYQAIAKVTRSGTEFQPKKTLLGDLVEGEVGLNGGWYAFSDLERAVEVKLLATEGLDVRVLSLTP